ncbi:uncharacterized protein CTRU02_212749 [Colletotrichum truncatum]|uniref:Uncharacterized protein n=1 Tax=Colletotrichum truncatum TaxID=5467 RepID=A0ACC3YIT5_COLTU
MASTAQMEFAKLLQSEFKTGVNSRRPRNNKGSSRGRGNGPTNDNKPLTLIDADLSAWVNGENPIKLTSASAAQEVPAAPTVLLPTSLNTRSGNVTPVEPKMIKPVTDQITRPSENESKSNKINCAYSVGNKVELFVPSDGQRHHKWVEDDATANKARFRNDHGGDTKNNETGMVSSFLIDLNASQPIAKSIDCMGQATRLLADLNLPSPATNDTSTSVTATAPVNEEPLFGTALWAFLQLESGRLLPNEQEFRACMAGGKSSEASPVIKETSAVQDHEQQIPTSEVHVIKELTDKLVCNCPKRSRPVLGLNASRFNTDSDGDVRVSDTLPTSVQHKFPVNVLLHDHPFADCPILEKVKAHYPLWFGATPATIETQEDNLDVRRWPTKTTATIFEKQKPGRSRGLTSSIWAD